MQGRGEKKNEKFSERKFLKIFARNLKFYLLE
jgi:hypothetical protein